MIKNIEDVTPIDMMNYMFAETSALIPEPEELGNILDPDHLRSIIRQIKDTQKKIVFSVQKNRMGEIKKLI
jgi:hypothetical protein